MADKLTDYRSGKTPLPLRNRLWPLYGAGFENMGVDGKPLEQDMPTYGPDELLIRHDACGLCFSDIKLIGQGQTHPRISKDMKTDPVVLGHEVSMTVVGVGQNLQDRYKVGDRLTLETDIYVNGIGYAYGYMLQGGLSQYSVIDQRVISSDHGDQLIRIKPTMGYAEGALTEPWACVVGAYRLQYRTGLKNGGTTWIIGAGGKQNYTISSGFDEKTHPSKLLITNIPTAFGDWLSNRAGILKVDVIKVDDISHPPVETVDDIVLLGADPDIIEITSPRMGMFGVMAILGEAPMARRVNIDVGRIHYSRWLYVGSTSNDIAKAYNQVPLRANLKPGGKTWFVGAGGPMGRMHVQRAISFQGHPKTMVCSDISDLRLNELCDSFGLEAQSKGIQWICLNPNDKDAYGRSMEPFFREGFDDIIMLVPVPAVIADAGSHLAKGGVMNIFAGVARGTMVNMDLSDVYLRDIRMIGDSGSVMDDMLTVLSKWESKELSTNRSVAAVGSLTAARDGLKAVRDTTFAGKVVIYPNIKELPLTAIADLKEKMPSVYAKMRNGEWTNEAEEEFLRLMLP